MNRLGSVLRGALRATSEPVGRLSEFRFAGRRGSLAVFGFVAAAWYLVLGYGEGLEVFLMICGACIVAFALLATLAAIMGPDAAWVYVIPVAAVSVTAAGFTSAAIYFAPDWNLLLEPSTIGQQWAVGAAFSAFFIGLSLLTTSTRRQQQVEFEAKQSLLEARLKTLSAQIEPHFLMNTLANASYLVETDARAAHRMLDHLANFLQGALEHSRDVDSTLGKEIELIGDYLAIMQIRLGDKLHYSIGLPEHLSGLPFPALLLQTLVENAVAHGIEPADGEGEIVVEAKEDDGKVLVTVADDGIGFDVDAVEEHTGLQNVRARLQAFAPASSSFEIFSSASTGTRATVTIPKTGL